MFTLHTLPAGEASSPPHSRYRVGVTPTKRGRVDRRSSTGKPEEPTPGKRQAPMSWAQRLKRVFSIDDTWIGRGGAVRFIACIEEPPVIEKTLAHIDAVDVHEEQLALAVRESGDLRKRHATQAVHTPLTIVIERLLAHQRAKLAGRRPAPQARRHRCRCARLP